MSQSFTTSIAPHVKAELALALSARYSGQQELEFFHLENAHVLGQESTYWHIKVHVLMLLWAVRNASPKEFFGQLMRIVGAATKTAIGLVPSGNTGGSNVSPFAVMKLQPEHEEFIRNAKAGL